MKIIKIILCTQVIFYILRMTTSAQLAVTVSPPKIVGQKTQVKLAMKNGLAQEITSARAVCFLLDHHGKIIGQSTKWVIGQNHTGLAPGATNEFNFVISNPQPFATTNLTANISFGRLVMADGKLANVRQSVIITPPAE